VPLIENICYKNAVDYLGLALNRPQPPPSP